MNLHEQLAELEQTLEKMNEGLNPASRDKNDEGIYQYPHAYYQVNGPNYRQIALAFAQEDRSECVWTYDEDSESWDTACDNKHLFTADGPKENEHTYCPYCGKRLKEA